MNFNLIKPCNNCPFTTDSLSGWLGEKRATEIINELYKKDNTFTCHKTVDYENSRNKKKEEHCAGALILMEKKGYANQLTRIAERLGIYDRNSLDMNANVFDTPKQFITHHTKFTK